MAKKIIPSAVNLGQEIINLPFVKKRTKGMDRNHFWSVEPTEDFTKDCQTGMAYAVLTLELMKKKNLRSLLTWVVLDMPRSGENSGIEIGSPGRWITGTLFNNLVDIFGAARELGMSHTAIAKKLEMSFGKCGRISHKKR
jgi:hypothetical protein